MQKELKKAIESLFEQLRFIATNLNDDQFSRPSVSLSGATIGQHFRHTLEFFQCLSQANDLVNYDLRSHEKLMESDTSLALMMINSQSEIIKSIDSNKDITLELSYGINQPEPIKVKTNLERELVYNVEHAVHHMAIIKIGLREIAPGLELPIGFGVADSTLQYQKIHQH